jgi:hypothetical protein
MMAYNIWPFMLKNRVKFMVTDIDMIEARTGVYIMLCAVAKVINDDDIMTRVQVCFREMPANKACASGDSDLHRIVPSFCYVAAFPR